MAAPVMDSSDWSSSDEDDTQDVETSVLLGVPDGPIDTESDLTDAAVSRIGGLPALLPLPEPRIDSSYCRRCSGPMELLVQLWCPFEGSAYDRALYIWGCSQPACQRRDGSVRAWRGLRYNESYARKLKTKSPRPVTLTQRGSAKLNPFALGELAPEHPGGLGTSLFGHPLQAKGDLKNGDSNGPDGDSDSESDSVSSVVVALASSTLSDSPWRMAPYHPAYYLSTISEYIPSPKQAKGAAAHTDEHEKDDGNAWSAEKYENSMHTDHIFEKFSARVALEPEQCVRYDLGGTPLPFAIDAVFNALFPHDAEHPTGTTVTKAEFRVPTALSRRTFNRTAIPQCPLCRSNRVFECQLMPNLINVLREPGRADDSMTDEERRKEVERSLKGASGRGMDWGTIMIFSCENDCCPGDDGKPGMNGWIEESVFVQWDD